MIKRKFTKTARKAQYEPKFSLKSKRNGEINSFTFLSIASKKVKHEAKNYGTGPR